MSTDIIVPVFLLSAFWCHSDSVKQTNRVTYIIFFSFSLYEANLEVNHHDMLLNTIASGRITEYETSLD